MSRAFTSSARAAKPLKWLPGKTTKSVGWVKRGIEEYIDVVQATYPQLANKVSKVTVGEVNGNPRPTPHQKGRNDPFHGSGAIGQKNLKKSDRETSLHVYPNGLIKPTNEMWPTIQVTPASSEELGEDAVWLDQKYCEDYALGRFNAGEMSENGPSSATYASTSSSSSGVNSTGDLAWRTNQQTQVAEWWDGTKWVEGKWAEEYKKWYAYHMGKWHYW